MRNVIRRQRGQADHTGATYAGKQIHGQREFKTRQPWIVIGGDSSRGYGQNEHKLDFSWGYKWHFYKSLRQEKVRFKFKDRKSSFKTIKSQFLEINSISFRQCI